MAQAMPVAASCGRTTWSTGDRTKFVERGSKETADQIDVGEEVALGGAKSDPQAAQLVVVPKQA